MGVLRIATITGQSELIAEYDDLTLLLLEFRMSNLDSGRVSRARIRVGLETVREIEARNSETVVADYRLRLVFVQRDVIGDALFVPNLIAGTR